MSPARMTVYNGSLNFMPLIKLLPLFLCFWAHSIKVLLFPQLLMTSDTLWFSPLECCHTLLGLQMASWLLRFQPSYVLFPWPSVRTLFLLFYLNNPFLSSASMQVCFPGHSEVIQVIPPWIFLVSFLTAKAMIKPYRASCSYLLKHWNAIWL